jgi:hydroxymethylpyrimidine/phosphomethylpyrimidine kinase
MQVNVLSIAGVDPSGGAGVLADLKTFSALGAYGCGVVTALTAQNTRAVTGVHLVPIAFIAQQIDTLFADVRIDAVKIGMLGTPDIVATVADRLAAHGVARLVVDPVMVAKSGDRLLAAEAVAALRERLLPMAEVLTPNLPEAADLLGVPEPRDLAAMHAMARALKALGPRLVMLKGGHLAGSESVDVVDDGIIARELRAPRIATRNTHGTGCTLSAAIAALLPQRADAFAAIAEAKAYLTRAIAASGELAVGQGHGPVHHFHASWPRG